MSPLPPTSRRLRSNSRPRERTRRFVISCDGVELAGRIKVPAKPRGVVVFAHGSGSNHRSPRNTRIAWKLQEAGLATILFDSLTHAEQALDKVTRQLRFDYDLHTQRLLGVLSWVQGQRRLADLPLTVFGSSAGAAAALRAAAERPEQVERVVCRGGRLDLVDPAILERVDAPTLLLVGALDTACVELNRSRADLFPQAELAVVPCASHLFAEAGKLRELAERAAAWITQGEEAPQESEPEANPLDALDLGDDWASQPVVIVGLDPAEDVDWLPAPGEAPAEAPVAEPALAASAGGRGWALDWRAA